MKKNVLQSLLLSFFLFYSCISNNNSKTNYTDQTNSAAGQYQGWHFLYQNREIPEASITNCYMISAKEYLNTFKDEEYLCVDPTQRQNSIFLDLKELNYFIEHSTRYGINKFITRINPEQHKVAGLGAITAKWEEHVVSGKEPIGSFSEYLGDEFKQKTNLCWLTSLQFLYLYSEGKLLDENYIFENSKNSGNIITTLLGLNIFNPNNNKSNQKTTVEQIPAGLVEILSGYGNESFWRVTNSQSRELIESLRRDMPVLLGQSYESERGLVHHVVVVLGAAYSRNTDRKNALGQIIGFYNFPGIPYKTSLKDTPFIFHQFLIFDPADASVREIEADTFIKSVDFFAIQHLKPTYSYLLKTRNLYGQ